LNDFAMRCQALSSLLDLRAAIAEDTFDEIVCVFKAALLSKDVEARIVPNNAVFSKSRLT
jgi:hypothetical protein